MKLGYLLGIALFAAMPAWATDAQDDAEPSIIVTVTDEELSQFLWTKRPLVVFSDSANDPRFIEQMRMIESDLHALELRDVVVLVDTDPAARSPLRQELRPRGFALVIIGKDGASRIRKPAPWSVREISRSIDKMPARLQEIRERGTGG